MLPLVLGVAGRSDAGKTRLILKLVPELIRRGYRVAAGKHCPHGFDLDHPGKDSWRFSQAGCDGVLLTSASGLGLQRIMPHAGPPLETLVARFFWDFDCVLFEGLGNMIEIPKVEVLRRNVSETPNPALRHVLIRISDADIDSACPVFRPEDIVRIADHLETLLADARETPAVAVTVNQEALDLNTFLRHVIANVIVGLVTPLRRRSSEEPVRTTHISVTRGRVAPERAKSASDLP